MSSPKRGSFEYLEAKIRRDAEGTLFGRDFEWVCQWYLEHAPLYRGKFRRVWRWAEWPDRWGPDCGIDLIAETHDGKLWAIQAKAVASAHTITKAEIDSFLSESNRREIAFRLLIATTDSIGPNARRTIDQQAKRASVVGRGDLLAADNAWPTKIGGNAPQPKRAKPRPHQRTAVAAAIRGFRRHRRGRLIMACGTGKTLTGLWIHERLKSRRTLLLVPSISLVQQNLREWGRHAQEDFDFLVVCSDESVASDRDDPALRYIAELGIDVTTDPREIAAFLAKRRRRPAVVIATYQSSDRVSAGQRQAKKPFDLALCDEAHRLVGDMGGTFATVLDDGKIRCRRRLFMTATPRYFTQRAKERAADLDLEVASMDDVDTFGPEFHALGFYDAITAKPAPLLTDYRVVVIGVTNADAAKWVVEGTLIRTRDGAVKDARTLAAQIGLAKAIRVYGLRRIITFHRSIRRASRFVDTGQQDSLPAVVRKLRPAARPHGSLWARHVSGETPASKRASILRTLAELPADTCGLVANCACLGEGVDVPALDGIAFIDPKGSMVDIIQAVGRVIRLSPTKAVGTIVIPVFVDESESAENALDNSAFEPVWQVLKALRAHDRRLADELDELRTAVGSQASPRRHITLPANIVLDIPRLSLKCFEQAFYVRAVMTASERQRLTIGQILAWADEHKARSGEWPVKSSGRVVESEMTWGQVDDALRAGRFGLTGGSSLPRLLAEQRGARYRRVLPPLRETEILRWADTFKTQTGKWPRHTSGAIPGTTETWAGVNGALYLGKRGLSGGSSLSHLLSKHGRKRNPMNLPDLTERQILEWTETHKWKTGSWPTAKSGRVTGTEETWAGVCWALRSGRRGLRRQSLAGLLMRHRKKRNAMALPPLTPSQILAWADQHKARTRKWPSRVSGDVYGTDECWGWIDSALKQGNRGLPGGSSLSQLLAARRRVRPGRGLPPLSIEGVLAWADSHHDRLAQWPLSTSGAIPGTRETWGSVHRALANGRRGLPGRQTLPQLLAKHRGVPNRQSLPKLTVARILAWCDRHKSMTGKWPARTSGAVIGTHEVWSRIDQALSKGLRGLPGGSSLAELLDKHRRGD